MTGQQGQASQPTPSTFPLNLLNGRRKRARTIGGEDAGDNDEYDESVEEFQTRLLQDIQLKLINLSTTVNEVSNKLDQHISSCEGDTSVKQLQADVLSTQQAILKIGDNTFEEDNKLKFNSIPQWGTLHRERRDAYYKYYAVTTEADIIQGFITSEPAYIMKEYRPKCSPGEKAARYKLREDHAKSAMMVEVYQKRITAKEKQEIYESVDSEVNDLCNALSSESDRDYLKTLWTKEVTGAEERSRGFFNHKKKKWLLSLPTKFPYEGQPKEPVKLYSTAVSAPVSVDNTSDNNGDLEREQLMDTEEDDRPYIVVANKRQKNFKVSSNLERTVKAQSTPIRLRDGPVQPAILRLRDGPNDPENQQRSGNNKAQYRGHYSRNISRGRGQNRGQGYRGGQGRSQSRGGQRRGQSYRSGQRGQGRGRGQYGGQGYRGNNGQWAQDDQGQDFQHRNQQWRPGRG